MGRRVGEKDKTLGKIKKLYLGCLIRERIFLSRRRVRTERGARSHHRLGLCQTVRQAASGKDRSPLRPGWWKTSWPLSFPPSTWQHFSLCRRTKPRKQRRCSQHRCSLTGQQNASRLKTSSRRAELTTPIFFSWGPVPPPAQPRGGWKGQLPPGSATAPSVYENLEAFPKLRDSESG